MYKKTSDEFDYTLNIDQEGIYSILMEASVSKKQFLKVELDGIILKGITSSKKDQYYSIPPDWNGNLLRGTTKIVVVIAKLSIGGHILKFKPKGEVQIISEPKINLLSNESLITILENIQSEERDRQPWITIALIDLPLKILEAAVTCQKRFWESDDVKLRIDDKTQKNPTFSWWGKYWFWQGRKLKGIAKTDTFFLDLEKSWHYMELWGDKTPKLNSLKLDLGLNIENDASNEFRQYGKIALYKDIEVSNFVNLRSSTEVTDNNIIAQLKDGETFEIIEEFVRDGKNEKSYVKGKSDVWHKVKYQEKTGFVLSSFVEIEGQERAAIIEKIRNQARANGIDENYAIALAGCESQYKPYAVSWGKALGIFQLTTKAREQLREKLNYDISDIDTDSFNINKNIEAGVTYLKWLLDIYKGSKDYYKKVTAAWNAGQSVIPIEGFITYDKISDSDKRKETQDLVERVELNRKRKDWNYIFLGFSILIFLFAGVFSFAWNDDIGDIFDVGANIAEVAGASISNVTNTNKDENNNTHPEFKFTNPKGDTNIKSVIVSVVYSKEKDYQTKVDINYKDRREEKIYSGYLENAFWVNPIYFNDKLVIVREEGQGILTTILSYDYKSKSMKEINFVDEDGSKSVDLCCSHVILTPSGNGVQYGFSIRGYKGEYESFYEYEPSESNPDEIIYKEKEKRKIEKGPSS